MKVKIYQVDAFAERPFLGNPAAVVILEEPQPSDWMQSVAKEMSLSETAFAHPRENGYHLRWFTPMKEVDLCGHATLATAHTLWETGREPVDQMIRFFTRSGWLSARYDQYMIELDFPSAECVPGDLSEEIIAAIGSVPDSIHFSGEKWLLEYKSEEDILNLRPDFSKLLHFIGRGLIVTSRSEKSGVDFVSRYFAPWIGVNEDPVTGSAHCILGPYWGERLRKDHMVAHQLSARGGVVYIRMSGERTYIGGKAVTVSVREMER